MGISGEYINLITCSNAACGFTSEGDWIEDEKVFDRWSSGVGMTLKENMSSFAKELGLGEPDFSGRYWRGQF